MQSLKQKITAASAAAVSMTVGASAFAAGPSAGDLSNLTPDLTTVLAAIASVGLVTLGVTLGIKGYDIVKRLVKKIG